MVARIFSKRLHSDCLGHGHLENGKFRAFFHVFRVVFVRCRHVRLESHFYRLLSSISDAFLLLIRLDCVTSARTRYHLRLEEFNLVL